MKKDKLCPIKSQRALRKIMAQTILDNLEQSAAKQNTDFVRSKIHGRKQARWC